MSARTKAMSAIRSFIHPLGINLVRRQDLEDRLNFERDVNAILRMPPDRLVKLASLRAASHSQLGQDLFVLSELDFRRDGYFVEFGATNGVDLSNTMMLEKDFGWQGILAEPARCWHDDLQRNRVCHIDKSCVWSKSKQSLAFSEAGELSCISSYNFSDSRGDIRSSGETYKVETISLIDLLKKHEAPNEIDYLSIDTEGSEFDILSAFDFDQYSFKVITCEHNSGAGRKNIYKLLKSKGYQRKYSGISRWDDWYIRADSATPSN